MSASFRVQGRLIKRRGPVVVRDETRRLDADSRDEALRVAKVLSGDGFTVWVWAVDTRSAPAEWDLVDRIHPPRHATDQHWTRGATGRVVMGKA